MFLKVSLWKICRATVDSFTPMYIGTARIGQWIIKKKALRWEGTMLRVKSESKEKTGSGYC